MSTIPFDPLPDGTLALLREGYRFIGRRCDRHGTDLFRTRLMLRPVVCMRGREAAELFYGGERFTRQGAVPARVRKLLQDDGSVQSLDGAAHRHRKQLFMEMMSAPEIARLRRLVEGRWDRAAADWRRRRRVVLHDEVQKLLCAAACDWIGIPLDQGAAPKSLEQATREQAVMVEGAGSIGPSHWRARRLRERSEAWLRQVVDGVRRGRIAAPKGSPLRAIVGHRQLDGTPLDRAVAAVELDNLLRPTVAIARFVVFSALALHRHPEAGEALRTGDEPALEAFVQEVRRFYPFFPFIGGRVRQPFEWRGHAFREKDWVLLDLYGTNHDARIWHEPESFRPERFRGREIGAYELVPQGAGDHHRSHRCPGEWITIELLKATARRLLALDYSLPEQDLTISLSRMPALPRSGFVIELGGST